MNQQRNTTIVGSIALIMATAPLAVVYKGLFEWLIPAMLVTAAITGAALGAKWLRGGPILQTLAMFAAGFLSFSWIFPSGNEIAGFIPTGSTLSHFAGLAGSAGKDIQQLTVPVDSTDGLVFIAVLGVACLALISTVLIEIARVPALAGIPILLLYVVAVTVLPTSVPWFLFIPGAMGYLWLLLSDNINRVRRYGRRFSADGQRMDHWDSSPLASAGKWLTTAMIAIALLLPAAMPGVTSGLIENWYHGGMHNVPGAGNTGSVNPVAELQGALTDSETVELGYVETNNADPGYMKMWSATNLDANGFTADVKPSDEAVPTAEMSGKVPKVSSEAERETWSAKFTTRELNDNALPLFNGATDVDVDGKWRYDPVAETVTSASSTTSDLSFNYQYTDYDFTPEMLREAPQVPQWDPVYKQNTEHPKSTVVSKLVSQLTSDKESQYDKVLAIHNHFSRDNGFSYDLASGDLDQESDNPIETFLTHTKKGYCQQYAASMAWMVREAGIPARVAIGLTAGTPSAEGSRLTNRNFHAWVEVYFNDYGWVTFDPTPSAGVRNADSPPWAPDPNESDQGSGDGEDSGASEPDDSGSPSQSHDPNKQNPNSVDSAGQNTLQVNESQPNWIYWIAGVAAAVAIALAPAAVRNLRSRRRTSMPRTQTVAAAHAAWIDVLETLTDLGLGYAEHESPRALATRIIDEYSLRDGAAKGLRQIAAAEERARYAPGKPSETSLKAAVYATRQGLYLASTKGKRLRAYVLPVSVLRSWSQQISRYKETMSSAIIAARMAVIRLGRKPRNTDGAA